MKKTLDILVKEGVAVHFPCILFEDFRNDNLFLLKLTNPTVENGSVVYHTAKHIFTEKELNRTALRYHSDCDILWGNSNATDAVSKGTNSLAGYVGIRTYMNRNGVMTTRFIIRFDATAVPSLRTGSCIGLFTAREIKRSRDRMCWFEENTKPTLFKKLRKMLHV